MSMLDIFDNDAFSMMAMLDTVDSREYVPSTLGSMGIFTQNPIREESVAIESRGGVLSLIKTSDRGAPLDQRQTEKRKIRRFETSRIAKGDVIRASELAFLRGHGQETQVTMLAAELARRMSGPMGLEAEFEMTVEHMRLGAVQGIVLDADDSVIYNWNTEFGVTPNTEIAFDFANMTEGDLQTICNQVTRSARRKSGGAWGPKTHLHAFCGDKAWDELVALEEVRVKYRNRDDAKVVVGGASSGSFEYGGIVWENYQGTDDNSKVAIHEDKIKLFPVNAPGAFLEVWAPGEKFEHLGQLGRRLYPMISRDPDDMFAELKLFSYPLIVATRPAMLQSGRRGA